MQKIDREGTFRGQITSYALQETKSSALTIKIHARIDEAWVDDEQGKGGWQDWREYECEATGYIWIIKKDGTDNAVQVRALVEHAAWDGTLVSISDRAWQPTPCQFVVTEDSPNDFHTDTRYRIAWLNNYDQVPTGGNVDHARAKELDTKYAARFRAVAGDVRRNATVPAGNPPLPPATASQGVTREEAAATQSNGKDIPF